MNSLWLEQKIFCKLSFTETPPLSVLGPTVYFYPILDPGSEVNRFRRLYV